MPKDFNDLIEEDREFIVRDQSFHWRDVRPEALTAFTVNEDADDPSAVWAELDKQILAFIDPKEDGHERWKELRARDDEPVTIAQLNAIISWLVEAQTGRPTEALSPSGPGRGKTAASSKAG